MTSPLFRVQTIRVRVVVEVDVDRDAYNREYGGEASVQDIRDHVRGEVVDAARHTFVRLPFITVESRP